MAEIPVGVKIIAVLDYIAAVALLLAGIGMFVGAGAFATYFSSIPVIGPMIAGLAVVLGIIFIALAVLEFFMGRGLWKGQNWARIVQIIFAIIGVIIAILGMVQGNITSNIISLVISGVIGSYLLFSNDVKSAFS